MSDRWPVPSGFDTYTCQTCEHSQRAHWHPSRRDNNRSYCTVDDCACVHFMMKQAS